LPFYSPFQHFQMCSVQSTIMADQRGLPRYQVRTTNTHSRIPPQRIHSSLTWYTKLARVPAILVGSEFAGLLLVSSLRDDPAYFPFHRVTSPKAEPDHQLWRTLWAGAVIVLPF
jgi:hypothetical protein